MYRFTIFVLISCVISQQLVAAVRRGGSRSGRSNLHFDSYDRPSLEELRESEDRLREAILMHPEEILDIPPAPVERDYEAMDFDAETLPEDYSFENLRDSQMTRGFINDLLEKIQAAFSKWPPTLPPEPPVTPVYYFQFDSSLLETQKTMLKLLLATTEEKSCNTIVENDGSPGIIFMGTEGCLIEAAENKIVIGYECFEPTMILKLIFKLFGFCGTTLPTPTYKASSLYLHSFRNKMQSEAEEATDCTDKFNLCHFLANGTSSLPCSSSSHSEKAMCSRTCRICGDTCKDYDSDCNTRDTLKDCLSNWDQKKLGCAKTCGACRNRKDPELCIDYFGCCRYYARRGYCAKFPALFKEYCPLSCGYCTPKSCADERSDCFELKKMGGCTKMAYWMEKSCRKTCNLCGNEVKTRDNEDRMPPEECIREDEFMQKYCTWEPFIIL